MDFQKLIEQFKDTENIKFIELIRTWQRSPDELFYEIKTSAGNYFIFEVDYIGDFNINVLDVIKEQVGEFTRILEVQSPIVFEQAEPVKRAKVYLKPEKWEVISLYANDKFGSYPFYFNFLVRK